MLRAAERHDGMPSIGRATKVAARQIGEIEPATFGCRALDHPHWQYGRQRFGCPENCLLVERLLRVSWKTTTPTSDGTGPPSRWIVRDETTAYNLLDRRDPGAATPKPGPQLLPP